MNSLEFYHAQRLQKPDTSESFYFHRKRKNKPDLGYNKHGDKKHFSGVTNTMKHKNGITFKNKKYATTNEEQKIGRYHHIKRRINKVDNSSQSSAKALLSQSIMKKRLANIFKFGANNSTNQMASINSQ